MEKAIDIANYIVKKYRDISGEDIDEMKLHKLLYFTQREGFAILNEPIISDPFEGWQHGPVCVPVRNAFKNGEIAAQAKSIPDSIQYIVDNVLYEYGPLASWKLREISHKDISWQVSRRGLSPTEQGHIQLANSDIQKDAEKVRPYDHIWDMYYDEFENEDAICTRLEK